MTTYLNFQLYGVLASWGEQATGESRHSANHPSRSAVLGLIAASLGIKRTEKDALQALSDSLVFGFKTLHHGLLLKDFHTAQKAVIDKKSKHFYTRRDEMRATKLTTVLSRRDYRQDAYSLVAVWLNEGSIYRLEDLQQSLKRPKFQLYLGRKSCPLSLPLNPQITQNKSFKIALDDYQTAKLNENKVLSHYLNEPVSHYFWENTNNSSVEEYSYRVPRYDQPTDRKHWQFSEREEYVLLTGEKNVS
ncbi:MAG: type I-E CRISPR-associated protein Cas5/CasD [Methylococcales bacterium]|nr:type I-E CRISPR-associated protein Cas5/CasD [Methylococcales bacterium]